MPVDTLLLILLIACVWVVPLGLLGLLFVRGSRRRARALDTDSGS
jgi:hypothetical protein